MREILSDTFTTDAEDIASIARSRLEGMDIDSTYEALMEADRAGTKIPELTDSQAWALRALGWISQAYDIRESSDGWAEGEDDHCLRYASQCLSESTHHARKPAEFRKKQSEHGENPAWYTEPLIEMCQKIRRRHPFYTAKDIFNSLPEEPSIIPIETIDLDEDGLTIIEKELGRKTPRTTGRPISMSGFRDFCTRHDILKHTT